jgi:hypothetical protein
MKRSSVACAAAAACWLVAVTASEAQPQRPRGFVGVGIAVATSDASSRMRLFEPSHRITTAEIGFALTPRIGVGLEMMRAATITATTRGRSFEATGRQQETAFLGLVRFRAGGRARVAVDLVGGAGLLRQHHEWDQAPCFSGCEFTRFGEEDVKAVATVAGVDIPLRLGTHVSIGPALRLYGLHRAHRVSDAPDVVAFPFETEPSIRCAASVAGRFTW